MSKLHIILSLQLDLFDQNNIYIERVPFPLFSQHSQEQLKDIAPKSVERRLNFQKIEQHVEDVLINEKINWIGKMFSVGFSLVMGSYNHSDRKYHLFIQDKNNESITPEKLSKALYFSNPIGGAKRLWLDDKQNILLSHNNDSEILKQLKLGKIGLVPVVENVLQISEAFVLLDKLPVFLP